jgi:hypothetical protein
MIFLLNIRRIGGLSRPALALAFFWLLWPASAAAQEGTALDSSLIRSLPPGFMDTLAPPAPLSTRGLKSPGGAMLRALALPGWGQYYTGHWVRGGLATVLETVFFTTAAIKYRDYSRQKDRLRSLEAENGPDWPVDDPQRLVLNQGIKNVHRGAADFLAYGTATLVLSLVDSYVSAHLYRFEENFQVRADFRGVEVSLRF